MTHVRGIVTSSRDSGTTIITSVKVRLFNFNYFLFEWSFADGLWRRNDVFPGCLVSRILEEPVEGVDCRRSERPILASTI